MAMEVRPGLAPGTWIGVFQIEAAIGAGGMGEVYRARDTKLDRHVAIKVLPDRLAADPDRRTRFAREARSLAALNHPHIAAIYGFEESGDSAAIVLEFVDGPTLGERLRNGPLPLDEALTVAVQIAEAIEAAHDRGIIHRDLKPANIKIAAGGVVKVLDFGLAKAAAGDAADGVTGSAALTVAGTEAGVIVGTAAYMSPEQARALAVDKRTDVWAFGCVLFEMLAGQRAFRGDTLPEILARVIEREPDWSLLPARTPFRIHDLLRRCLEKDPKKRRRDIADVRLDLEHAQAAPANLVPGLEPGRRPGHVAVVWTGVALLAALATGAAIAWRVMPPAGGQRFVLEIPSPPTRDPESLAVSRDGRQVVFAATVETGTRLLLRTLETGAVRQLRDTDGGQFPFWSPDGRAIGFFAEGTLKRIDLASGTVLPLAPASNPGGGAWNTDGTILFVPVGGSPVMRIPEGGGGKATAVTPASMRGAFANPKLLPDGRHYLFNNTGPAGGLYVGSLDQQQNPKRIENMLLGEYASSGYLFFMRIRTLYAQRFDSETAKLSGTAIQIADNVTALSAGGDSIAYRANTAASSALVWFNRSGEEVDRLPGEGNLPSISRNGRVVVMRDGAGTNIGRPELWMWSGANGFHKFGVEASAYNTAIWSHDDAKIYFSSPRDGHPFTLYEKASDGSGVERLVKRTDQSIFANDRSGDGRFIIYRSSDPKSGFDLWKLTLADEREEPLVNTSANEREAQFSPDGRWFAYQSDEGGHDEIYIKPFPDAERTRIGPVSVNGGTQVRWNPAGGELFYLRPDGYLMSVAITESRDGRAMEAPGAPSPLFQTNIRPAGVLGQQYAVAPDGQRFLINTKPEAIAPITILLNWKPGS